MAGGDYGRVRHSFWNDPDVKRVLTPDQKLLLLYYFTSPHGNMIGLYSCPFEYAAAETGIPIDQVRTETLGPLSRFVTYDERTEEILVHRAAIHQVDVELKPRDNRIKAIQKIVGEAHSQTLIARFLELYSHWPLGLSTTPPPPVESPKTEAPSKPLTEPLRSHSSSSSSAEHSKAAHRTRERAHEAPPTVEPEPETTTAADDWTTHRDACAAFVTAAGYGPTEQLIASGEDKAIWQSPTTGEPIPWNDRLRLLKLSDVHLKASSGAKCQNLRQALKYVKSQQLDPIASPTAEDFAASRPKPGTDAARILSSSRDPEPGAGRIHQPHVPTGPQLVKIDPLESYRSEQEARAARIATLPQEEQDSIRELAKRKAGRQSGDVAYVEGVFISLALEAVAAKERLAGRSVA